MGGTKMSIQLLAVGAALGLLLASGCATDGALLSTRKIQAGEKAIMDAKAGNASVDAPAELNVAEENLSQAREAQDKKEYEKAARLAERASVDAEYARTKATTEKAKKPVEEMRKNNEVLRQEIERLSKP